MSDVEASYLTLRPGAPVSRTVEVEEGRLLVDVDEHGQVVGIERIGGEVGVGELVRVLHAARLETR